MPKIMRYLPDEMFNARFLTGMLNVPTGAVVRRLDEFATVVMATSNKTLLVETRAGHRQTWDIEQQLGALPLEVHALPEMPELCATTGSSRVAKVNLGPLLMHAPASLIADLRRQCWQLALPSSPETRRVVTELRHFLNMSQAEMDELRLIRFDGRAVMGWLKQFRLAEWTQAVVFMMGLNTYQLPSGQWQWGDNGEFFDTYIEAALAGALTFEAKLFSPQE